VKYETIEVTKKQGVTILTLNRPAKLNAISARMTSELQDAFERFQQTGVPSVLITGKGRAFCAGVDLTEIRKRRAGDAFERRNAKLFDSIESFPGIIAAAINGLAYGGGFELTLACDFRFAAPEAVFCLPEVKLGILPSAGGLRRLPPLVGFSAAKDLILSSRKITALEALSIGLTHHIEPAGSLLRYSIDRIREIQAFPQNAIRAVKSIVNAQMQSSSPDRIAIESFAQALLFEAKTKEP
jgi:enoyl-CoA hydratase/carnithine racemase